MIMLNMAIGGITYAQNLIMVAYVLPRLPLKHGSLVRRIAAVTEQDPCGRAVKTLASGVEARQRLRDPGKGVGGCGGVKHDQIGLAPDSQTILRQTRNTRGAMGDHVQASRNDLCAQMHEVQVKIGHPQQRAITIGG